MLVGTLVLMHGLAAHAGNDHAPAPTATAAAHGGHDNAPADHDSCADCLDVGNVMAACMAIVAAVAGVRLARRALARGDGIPLLAVTVDRVQRLVESTREPDPAWVRLAVMRF